MSGGAVLLFDGVCNLCSGTARFAIRRDPDKKLKFASLQSEAGQRLLALHQLPAEDFRSMVLIEDGKAYTKSSAVLRFFKKLRQPWPLLYAFAVVPRPVLDFFYDKVSRNRYRWYGKKESCWLPTPELKDRFLS